MVSVRIIRSASFGGWYVNENEQLELPDSLAAELIEIGIAVPDGPQAAAIQPVKNMSRKKPQLQTRG